MKSLFNKIIFKFLKKRQKQYCKAISVIVRTNNGETIINRGTLLYMCILSNGFNFYIEKDSRMYKFTTKEIRSVTLWDKQRIGIYLKEDYGNEL